MESMTNVQTNVAKDEGKNIKLCNSESGEEVIFVSGSFNK
jgi:hypothetical protein